MIGLDTNVLARIMLGDDERQLATAERVLANAVRDGTPLYIGVVVWCELVWLLEKKHHVARGRVAEVIRDLLESELVRTRDRRALDRAIERYARGRGDLADYIIGDEATEAGATEVVTFDRGLRREAGFRLLGS